MLAIDGVVTEQLLRPQLISDRRERLRQRAYIVGAIDLSACPVGDLSEITVSLPEQIIQHTANRIVLAPIVSRTSCPWIGDGPRRWSSRAGKGIVGRIIRRSGISAATEKH